MNRRGFLLVATSLLLALSFASAAVTIDSNGSAIKKSYSVGDYVSGTLTLTLSNESADSKVTTSAGGSYTLGQWLDMAGKQAMKDYQCSISGCDSSYRAIDDNGEVTISLSDSKTVGFVLSGSNVSVKSMSFRAQTTMPNSCSKQFALGVFDDDEYTLENYLTTGSLCGSPKRGCFDSGLESSQYSLANLTTNEYCEKISLSPAPSYRVGSSVSGPLGPLREKLTMRMYSSDFTILYGQCELPISGELQDCSIDYPVTRESERYICISSNMSNSAYQIKTEQRDNRCGTTVANKNSPSTIDFDIWAQPLEYSSTQIPFDYDKFALLNFEANWTELTNQYLKDKYNSNCLDFECFVPFKAVGQSQTISFSDPVIVYESDGVIKTSTRMSELATDSGTITSGKLTLPLDVLEIPITKKITTLEVKLGTKSLIKSTVEVKESQVDISPTFALIGVPTQFKMVTNLSVSSAEWKFSNSATPKSGLTATQTFSSAGTYTVEVSASTANGTLLARTRSIIVGEPKASAQELIDASQASIGEINSQINSLPAWTRAGVQAKVDPIKLNSSLLLAEQKYANAKTDAEYIAIIGEVQALNVPTEIGAIKTGKFPLLSGYSGINAEHARTIEGGEFDDEQFKAALAEWLRVNYNTEVEMETTGASFSSGTEAIITRVKIVTNPIVESNDQRYLVLNVPFESAHFMTGYSQKELDGGTYLPLEPGQQVIEFYVDGDVAIDELGAYILPSLSELQAGGYSYEVIGSNADRRNKTIYIALSILTILLIAAIYGLQYWYRNNYERHLFYKQEELFNIMTFIFNSQKAGLMEGDIRKKLLTSGWSREQISYAFGRLKGRIFGLFGLPIYSAKQEKKVKEEIETRQKRSK